MLCEPFSVLLLCSRVNDKGGKLLYRRSNLYGGERKNKYERKTALIDDG
jgi:hypothetical protein